MIFYEFHTIFMALARSLARQRVELIELAELQHMHVRHVQHKSQIIIQPSLAGSGILAASLEENGSFRFSSWKLVMTSWVFQ